MKKFWKIGLSAFLTLGLLAACGQEEKNDKSSNEPQTQQETSQVDEATFPMTITDAIGKDITLEAPPEKIVSLIPSNTEILFSLGLKDEIVGVTDNDDYPPEVAEKEKVGGMEYNIEKIIALNPDIVFSHESSMSLSEAAIEQLESAGVKVFVVNNAQDFNETYTTIEQLGRATGKLPEAEEVIANMKAKVEEVLAKVKDVEPKKVLVEASDEPDIYTAGNGTFMNAMLEMIHAENVAADADDWYKIDAEQIIAKNPDVIVVTYHYVPDILTKIPQRAGFDTINAVKNKAIVQVDENTTSRQGPRLGEGLEELAKAIYPEVFK
ncbi:ABC transporter substrate-binding protein [Lysinibacillus irui]|uniref:ABC transporter substrate-binding protein n=1 Tax=Lysinibacillus irui TaxID=2998077 RepID=A0AAJ5UTU7_9BACI|nr:MULTISPECIES: ABC transporter substrate-binding protein [Lysinibacillus]MEA0553944.1 ABC transporter substrate-binding protein [Lysinibacillus irui]MEA0561984.1 ABC transporter substrate-binding protein [Lysinibacillus irui]MEA0975114.1 ABC transporter substrate-binding protein [Lysinibacillus irui]MEA1041268.1 ABC transporter substrate-binding protein [Lysinibacillus irui]WDV07348.1 ABC transporter substrate-binding protein [Lysinibacillus irui]